MENYRNLLAAKTLIGDKVVNAKEENLGKIEELMIDLSNGRVGYAVLSFGGLFGIGDKLFALPWSALTVDQKNKRFVLNVDKAVLENAPGFNKDTWPDMSDPAWNTSINSYYKTKPYWE